MKHSNCTGLQVYHSENDLLIEQIQRSTRLMRLAAYAAAVLASGSVVIVYLVTSAA